MYLTLFALIGLQIGAGKPYWGVLAFSAILKIIEVLLNIAERKDNA
jgi:hypothetical protein